MNQAPLQTSTAPHQPPPAPRSRSGPIVVGSLLFVMAAAAASWVAHRRLDDHFTDLDVEDLRRADSILDVLVDQQRARLIASVRMLAEDTRIRSTAATTGFDETTIRDVLEDLKKASDVGVLAVLDESGKVRAITGAEGLRQMDLSASPVIKAAQERPASYFWTLPNQALIIGVAPIHAGPRVAALLLMGTPLGVQQLGAIQRTLGVAGAVFSGDRLIVSDPAAGALEAVFKTANARGGNGPQVVRGDVDYLTRVTRTNDSATAANVVWLVPRHRMGPLAQVIRVAIWVPAACGLVIFGLGLLSLRKLNGGTREQT
jgi:hypothetical protein